MGNTFVCHFVGNQELIREHSRRTNRFCVFQLRGNLLVHTTDVEYPMSSKRVQVHTDHLPTGLEGDLCPCCLCEVQCRQHLKWHWRDARKRLAFVLLKSLDCHW